MHVCIFPNAVLSPSFGFDALLACAATAAGHFEVLEGEGVKNDVIMRALLFLC